MTFASSRDSRKRSIRFCPSLHSSIRGTALSLSSLSGGTLMPWRMATRGVVIVSFIGLFALLVLRGPVLGDGPHGGRGGDPGRDFDGAIEANAGDMVEQGRRTF